jgi:hypothetical protein
MAVDEKKQTAGGPHNRYARYVEKHLPCFYCNKPLQEWPVVGWDGHGEGGKLLEIVMHPDCTNGLLLRLASDVLIAERAAYRAKQQAPGSK